MELIKKYRIGIAVILGIIVIGGLSYFLDRHNLPVGTVATTTPSAPGITVGGVDGATVTDVPLDQTVPQPPLDRPITFVGSPVPPDAQPAVRANIEATVSALKKTPNDLTLWLTLGLYRKQAGDYEGAALAWLYIHQVSPQDEISVLDLADLYMNFIKDYPKAEMYEKLAITNKPDSLDNYRNLFVLYKYLYKTDTSAAADTQKEAARLFPNDADYIASWQ